MELWVPLEVYPCISNSVCKDLQTQLHEVLFKRKKGKCQYLPRDKNEYFQRDSDESPGQGRESGHDQRPDEGGPQHHQEQQRQDPGREQETQGRDGETEKSGEQEKLGSECCQKSFDFRYIKPSGSEGGEKSFICSGKK